MILLTVIFGLINYFIIWLINKHDLKCDKSDRNIYDNFWDNYEDRKPIYLVVIILGFIPYINIVVFFCFYAILLITVGAFSKLLNKLL